MAKAIVSAMERDWETEADVDALKRVAEIQKDPARKKRALKMIQEQHSQLNTAESAISLRSPKRSQKRS